MHQIEAASFASWPALEEMEFNKWKLRFANGFTKRANSANAIGILKSISDSEIDFVEDYYRTRKQSPIFRLASFCTNKEIDNALLERGYSFIDLSLIMTASLDKVPMDYRSDILADASTWCNLYYQIVDMTEDNQNTHIRMLNRINGNVLYAVIMEEKVPVCCGLGVVHDNLLGLYDLVTAPAFRGKGLATKLCSNLMSWAKSLGAVSSYVQVVGGNSPAINLYEKLGYRTNYHYWYRIKKQTSKSE